MCVSMNRWLAVASAAALVFGVADLCSASVAVSEPTVAATGAKPKDQEAAIPAAMTETQCTGTQCPVAKAEGPKKFCYAGAGRVVDDKTGKPVELFAYQEGLPNSKSPSGVLWICTYGAHRRRGGQFSISHSIVRGEKVRVRVLAYGYLPEVAVAETDKEGRLIENPLVFRLRRGIEVRGRVLDHQGKPVVGAKVFLQGKGRLVALQHRISRLGVETVSTDSDGRFVTTGGGEPVTHVIVYAPHLHIWAVPIPDNLGEPEDGGPEELTIRLPQPATLKVVFDIPGAVDKHEVHVQEPGGLLVPAGGKAQLQLNLKKMHGEGWKGATDACQMAAVANPGEVVIDNLAPGVYDFRRTINLETRGGRGMRSRSSGRRDITLRPGETQVVRFVRDKGQRVTGEIQGLPEGSSDALVTVSPLGNPGKRGEQEPFDWVSCERDGSFVTPLLAPGDYHLSASVHAPPKPRDDASWRIPTPDDVGAVNVTIKESGPPVEVRIEMKPRSANRKARPSADGRATLAPKPTKAAAEPTVEAIGAKQDNQTPAGDAGSSSPSSSSSSLPQWGEAVDGVQVRLRAKQSTWNEGSVPRLWADVRNQGKRDLLVRTRDHGCELEVDGQWYRWPVHRGTIPPPRPFPPGRQYDDIAVVLGRLWWKAGPEQLGKLTPGIRTVRVAFAVAPGKNAPGKPFMAVSNPVAIEIVAKSDEKVDATPEGNTSTTPAEPKLDGKEILDKLKSIDAVYAAAFTASGTRLCWPRKKWKFTMHRGRIALEEEVVDIPGPTATNKKSYGPSQVGRFIAMRSTWYIGPTAQATYDWVGRIPRYGPLDPWPENDPGPATTGSLKVDDPDAPTYTLHIQRTLLCLGRGYSRYITKIRDVGPQEDGRLKVTADGLDGSLRPGAKWELLIDPDAEYMVRSAEVVAGRNRRRSYTNSGLTRHGPHCVPEKGKCKGGFISASFEFESASFEADVEFLKHAKATMQPPYLLRTDVSDQRRTPELRIQYEAGKMSPRGGKPGLDLGWKKEAASDRKEVPASESTVAGTGTVAKQPKDPPAPNTEETQRDVELPPAADKKESAEKESAAALTQPGATGEADKQPRATGASALSGRVAKYVQQFDEQTDDKFLRRLEELKKSFVKSKERGWKPPWGGIKRARSRADYEKMSTADLAKECFSTSVWAREIFIHNHPTYGIARAGVFHDGLSVLYERPDFWKGMVAVYKELGDRMGKAKTEHERMDILFNLQTLRWAYIYPDFRKTLPGHERDLLRAHVAALKAVLSYTTEAQRKSDGSFWGAQVAGQLTGPALALLKRVDPKAYLRLFEQIQTVEIPRTKPHRGKVANYLQLVIPQIEQAIATGDSQTKDTGEDRA